MLTISSGHSAEYLTAAVAAGRENYYTGAVAAGEPPGRWYGTGADALGLTGLVDTQDMTALYERFIDPRDPAFRRPGEWDDAATLGHTGRRYQTEDQIYTAALAAEPGASPERRAELRIEAGTKARRNVSFLDATFSVQKSVTVLHAAFEAQEVAARRSAALAAGEHASALAAGEHAAAARAAERRADAELAEAAWAGHRDAVETAIWAGNRAALDYLADKAGYSRTGHHGGAAGRFIDAHDWTIASFFQHDNRDHDPQLHIHNAILNRVQGTDGIWRTLHGRALYAYRGAAAAVGERTMEEHLTASLGVRFATRPDGKAREIVGVRAKVLALFSSRRRAITAKTAQLVHQFEARFGRSPNGLELDRLQRTATFATRAAKSHEGETAEARLDRWDAELRAEVTGDLAGVADDVLTLAGRARPAELWSPTEVITTALADIQARKAAWTGPDLTRAISDALPDHLGQLTGDQLATLLDTLTARALTLAVPLTAPRLGSAELPDELRLADGRSVYEAPAETLYAAADQLPMERALLEATGRRGAPAVPDTAAAGFLARLAEAGVELGADQAAAVRGVLTSAAAVETLVGPAGTGKSYVVGALARAWTDPDLWDGLPHQVVGLATSQIATEVLTGEGLPARNVARWLATQQRLSEGRPGPDDLPWRLSAGDLVVVDESAMSNTADLSAIHAHADRAGAKLLLVGDHRQLAAVGAGGGMDLAAHTGPAYELAEARRFTAEWERTASLQLRDADPAALQAYHQQGRLVDAGTVEAAERSAARAWLADTLTGKRSTLVVDTNEQAARVSAHVRAELIRLGRVDDTTAVPLGLQGTWASPGDLVQARRLGWDLIGYEGNTRPPITRETYRVLQTRADGGLLVAPIHTPAAGDTGERLGPTMALPPEYVTEHLALGYASTAHAAQGTTVDTAHTVVTPGTSPGGLYVGLSRGRHSNTAHVVTQTAAADAPTGEVHHAAHRTPAGVLARILDAADPERSALMTAVQSGQDAGSVRTAIELLADGVDLATAGRTARWLDQLAADGHLTAQQRMTLAAEDGAASISRLLRRVELAGHDPAAVLRDVVTSRSLDDAKNLTNVIRRRVNESGITLDPAGESFADQVPKIDNPAWQRYLGTLAAAADQRRTELGVQVAGEQPQWAVEALGQPPAEENLLREWQQRAGAVAAYRELAAHEDGADPLGPPPKAGQTEAHALWRTAWRALGRPEADLADAELDPGQLHMRVRAYEREQTWEPRYVGNELAGTRQAADHHRAMAALRAAEADTPGDPARRAELRQAAADAAALARTLDQRVADLETASTVRAEWYAHTAATRAAAERARAELQERVQRGDGIATARVTAEEWLAEQAKFRPAEEQHRPIRDDADLTDITRQRAADTAAAAASAADDDDVAETGVADIRDLTAGEPPQTGEDEVRVPTAGETAASVRRAQQALAELRQRQAADERRETERARAQQLTRWHADQAATDTAAGTEHAAEAAVATAE